MSGRWVTPRPLSRCRAALRRAERLLVSDRASAVAEVALATGLPPELAVKAMARHTYRLDVDEATLMSLREIARFLCGQGVIKTVPEFNVFK
jgi:hypothetical protein